MTENSSNPPAESTVPPSVPLGGIRGLVRLAVDGVVGATHIAEGLHSQVARRAPPLGRRPEQRTSGITGFVYSAVRGTSTTVGRGLDAALARLQPLLRGKAGEAAGAAGATDEPTDGRLAALAVLNGVLGDHLDRTGNPLALPMSFRLPETRGPDVVVLVHGLCMNDRQWTRAGHDHGELLQRSLGWSPVYLRYNSGRHVSMNGAELARRLDELLASWPVPVERLALIGHSMGGLVLRSALHQAQAEGRTWPALVQRLVFLGTPHHGAVLERGGNLVQTLLEGSPYLKPFARLARLRSDGITDLRHGNLLQQDWEGDVYAHRDTRKAVPLPHGVACHAIAGALKTLAADAVVGDGLVSVDSALGRHPQRSRHLRVPASHRWVARGVGHLGLLGSSAVGAKLLQWFRST